LNGPQGVVRAPGSVGAPVAYGRPLPARLLGKGQAQVTAQLSRAPGTVRGRGWIVGRRGRGVEDARWTFRELRRGTRGRRDKLNRLALPCAIPVKARIEDSGFAQTGQFGMCANCSAQAPDFWASLTLADGCRQAKAATANPRTSVRGGEPLLRLFLSPPAEQMSRHNFAGCGEA
jgi:hypothetical protein